MKTCIRSAAALAALVFASAGVAMGQSDQQTVTIEVQAINEIAVVGNPTLTINAATAGGQPVSVTDNTASYSITTNETGRSIQVAIDNATPLPAGLTLTIELVEPAAGGTSTGSIDLTTTAQDAVTGIGPTAESGLGITYTLTADVTAGVVPQTNITVVFTVI